MRRASNIRTMANKKLTQSFHVAWRWYWIGLIVPQFAWRRGVGPFMRAICTKSSQTSQNKGLQGIQGSCVPCLPLANWRGKKRKKGLSAASNNNAEPNFTVAICKQDQTARALSPHPVGLPPHREMHHCRRHLSRLADAIYMV